MDLDEMKQTWATMDARLDALEAAISRDRLARSRAALRWTSLSDLLELIFAILLVAVVAPFWIRHRAIPHLLIAGLVLHAYGIAVIWSLAVRVLLVGRIYYTKPVLIIQQRLAVLRRFRIRASLALGLSWWLLWVPCTMVAAYAWCGVDLYAQSPVWVLMSLGVGVIGIIGCLVVARWLAGRAIASPMLTRWVDSLAGHGLRRASEELDELATFRKS
jgi:hypothetical protein